MERPCKKMRHVALHRIGVARRVLALNAAPFDNYASQDDPEEAAIKRINLSRDPRRDLFQGASIQPTRLEAVKTTRHFLPLEFLSLYHRQLFPLPLRFAIAIKDNRLSLDNDNGRFSNRFSFVSCSIQSAKRENERFSSISR